MGESMNVHTAEQTKQFEVLGTQRFTWVGWRGVWLFILSPFANAACYVWLVKELAEPYNQNLSGPIVGLIVSSLTFLVGIVLLIVGREQRHIIKEFDPGSTNSSW